MSREIKFRAWDRESREMLPFELFDETWIQTDRFHDVMQYTGLKDKNGVEIYDGDVLKGFGGRFECYWHEEGSWEFRWLKTPKFGAIRPGDMEVIGNIHENPELLK